MLVAWIRWDHWDLRSRHHETPIDLGHSLKLVNLYTVWDRVSLVTLVVTLNWLQYQCLLLDFNLTSASICSLAASKSVRRVCRRSEGPAYNS